MAQKKVNKQKPVGNPTQQVPELDVPRESLLLGHMIKYNLYLLTKSIIFSAILKQVGDVDKSVIEANRVIGELDLDTKRKNEQQ